MQSAGITEPCLLYFLALAKLLLYSVHIFHFDGWLILGILESSKTYPLNHYKFLSMKVASCCRTSGSYRYERIHSSVFIHGQPTQHSINRFRFV